MLFFIIEAGVGSNCGRVEGANERNSQNQRHMHFVQVQVERRKVHQGKEHPKQGHHH